MVRIVNGYPAIVVGTYRKPYYSDYSGPFEDLAKMYEFIHEVIYKNEKRIIYNNNELSNYSLEDFIEHNEYVKL